MSIKVRNACKPLRVKAPEKAVLLALADYAGHDGGSIYPALETLAEETCYCIRAIRNAISGLLERGVLKAARLNRGGRHVTNSYAIDLDRVAEMTGQQPVRNPAPRAAFEPAEPQENPAPNAAFQPDEQPENPARGAENPASGAADPSRTKEERELQATLYCSNSRRPQQWSPKVNHPDQTDLLDLIKARRAAEQRAAEQAEAAPVELSAEPIASPAPVMDQPAAGGAVVLYLAADRGSRCKATGDANFDEFYAAYPRHIARRLAATAYANALKRGVSHAAIMQGLAALLAHLETNPDFPVPYPATWLNGERWDDDLTRGNRFGGQGNGQRNNRQDGGGNVASRIVNAYGVSGIPR
jgi:Helix-turn-helix domain